MSPADDVATVEDRAPPEAMVAGIGNVLMRDDAFGPHVVRTLEAGWATPDEVELRDLGTPGGDLVDHVRGVGTLLVVDTVRADGQAGKLLRYDGDRLRNGDAGPRTSPHDPGLTDALSTLALLEEAPREVVLLGVIPADVDTGLGLSPAVSHAVPWAAAAVLRELRRAGYPLRRRVEPRPPDLWWLEGPGRAGRTPSGRDPSPTPG